MVLVQMDVLEHPLVRNIIVPQTVVEEAKHRDELVHSRLRFVLFLSFSLSLSLSLPFLLSLIPLIFNPSFSQSPIYTMILKGERERGREKEKEREI